MKGKPGCYQSAQPARLSQVTVRKCTHTLSLTETESAAQQGFTDSNHRREPREPRQRKRMAPLILLSFGLLMLGSAKDLPCAVSHGAGRTGYSVPAFNASSCHYWWANGTSHVIANHEEEIRYLVLTKSIMTLNTSTCLEQVLYKRDCISEGISFQATCTTICIGNASRREIRLHSCIAVFVLFTLLLVGLFLYAVRCGKCCCSNTEADVEAQRG